MTPQERQLLDDFLGRLASVESVAKDAEANALIRQRLADQPDALYLLVQRALLLDRALETARQQIAQLQQQVAAQGAPGASFLGGAPDIAFGRSPSPDAGRGPAAVPPSATAAAPMQPPGWRDRLFGGSPAGAAPAATGPAPGAAGSGFLGQAARTAAGVAGGMFLFNGLENLLGHHGGGGGFLGGGNSLLGGVPPAGETVVQNITNENFFPDNASGGDDGGTLRTASDDSASWLPDNDGSDFQDDGGSFI
ncbi:MAG: hypothetical protein JWQ03_765 [Variovorax sp.]|nr:hypothetical protein [Variovorax sp.]